MGKFLRIIIAIAAILCFQIPVLAVELDGNEITSAGAVIIDFETGAELFGYNADVARAPASMTKMMAVYLVYEAVADGRVGFDTVVPISEYAYGVASDRELTNVPLSQTEAYTVDELLDAVIIASACGATEALAELVGGTRENFLQMMNDKAAEWGIDAVFHNTFGYSGRLHSLMTPRAMAILTRNILLDFPEVLEKTSAPSVTFNEREYNNTNKLLGVYEGVDGFKTGYKSVAGGNFAGTARRGDIRIITVTMGSELDGRRFVDTAILLDYGFAAAEELHARLAEERLEASKAPPLDAAVIFDGAAIEFDAYIIEGESCFNIRDLAYILNGTAAQFSIELHGDTGTLILTSGEPYAASGGEMAGGSGERKLYETLDTGVMINGEFITAYDIDGNIYMDVRAAAAALGFNAEWDNVANWIIASEPVTPPRQAPGIPHVLLLTFIPAMIKYRYGNISS